MKEMTKMTVEIILNIMIYGIKLFFLIFYLLLKRKDADLSDYFKWISFSN